MRISPVMRGARAFALATLVVSLDLSPSYARMSGSVGGSFARPAFGMGHFSRFPPGGLNRRFETGRFGFNRLRPGRFDRFGFNRFNRFGWNPLFIGGGWGWGGWGDYSAPPATQPLIVGDGAPVIINIGVDPALGAAAGGSTGGCVIHKLNYDSNGKYIGERQIPQC
ncbi:MAG: hypothetical protein WCF81_17765 [Roseiarcus sp.]